MDEEYERDDDAPDQSFEGYVRAIATLTGSSYNEVAQALSEIIEEDPDKKRTAHELLVAVQDRMIQIGIAECVRNGELKLVGYNNEGEALYSMTKSGRKRVARMMKPPP